MYIPVTHRNQTNQLHRSCGFKVTYTHTHTHTNRTFYRERFIQEVKLIDFMPNEIFENVLYEKFAIT